MGGPNWHTGSSQKNFAFKRSYEDLPDHKYIRFTLSFWAIDSWGPEDSFQVQFDSLTVFENLGIAFGNSKENICARTTYKDFAGGRIFGWTEHSSLSLLLTIISKMDSSTYDESFGIRDIKLLFTDIAPATPSICAYAGDIPKPNQLPCPCSLGQYKRSSSECAICHADCAACYGPGSENCFECAPGRYFDGVKCMKCFDSLCSACSGPDENECIKCAQDGYVVFNGKCVSENRCQQSPMVLDTCGKTCQSSCSLEDLNSWKVDCFPPCPAGSILTLQFDCLRKNFLIDEFLIHSIYRL